MSKGDQGQGAAAPAPAPRDACLMFRDGKLIAVETASGTYVTRQLVERNLLTFTDQMILTKLADRVDRLIGQLA